MEVYKRETNEIVRKFMTGRLSAIECMSALDSALDAALPGISQKDFLEVRAIAIFNAGLVQKEVERRGTTARPIDFE